MVLIIRELALHKLITRRLTIVREIKQVNEVRLLALDSRPAEVDDGREAERSVVLFPAVADKDWVRLREWNELEFYRVEVG